MRVATSPVPPSASRPDSCSRACSNSAGDTQWAEQVEQCARIDRARTCCHRHAFEWGESHRRVDRPTVAHGCDGTPAAEVADDEARHRHLLRGPRDRQAVEAEAPNPERSVHARGAGRWGRPAGSSGGTPCRRRRRGEPRQHLRASLIAASAGAICSGASSTSSSSAADHVVVEHCRLDEPFAAVHDSMRDGRDGAARRATRSAERRLASTTLSLRLVEPALTTRTSVSRATSSRGLPGSSSPCSRVYARAASRRSLICWRRCAARSARPGTGRSRRSRGGNGRGR